MTKNLFNFRLLLILLAILPLKRTYADSPTTGSNYSEPQTVTADPQIWSRPEPGHVRETNPVNSAPVTEPPIPWFEQRRKPVIPNSDSGQALTELGITLGTPALVNLNVGYWASRELPLVLRLSGMYYGDTRGIQLDVGYAFERSANFRQYIGLSFVTYQSTTDYYSFWTNTLTNSFKNSFAGIGPNYGLNWDGFSLQISFALGQENDTQNFAGGNYYTYNGTAVYRTAGVATNNQFGPQVLFQVGYTFLW